MIPITTPLSVSGSGVTLRAISLTAMVAGCALLAALLVAAVLLRQRKTSRAPLFAAILTVVIATTITILLCAVPLAMSPVANTAPALQEAT